VDKNIETPAQSRVDVFDCTLEMWLEVLALNVQDVEAVTFVTVLFRCGKPWDIKDLNKMVYIMFLEDGRIEDSGDRSKVESTGIRAL
jgi:hypothetical protein